MRHLFHEIDPTRVAYHEGDTSMWDERELEIVSRHYGKESAGEGWWDERQPLHSGEMSMHHLMGPNNTLHLGGDATFADYAEVERGASEDARRIIESGRSRGVIAWGPWNLSCLANLRMESRMIRPRYDDWTAPGVKPLQVPPHSSEFAFWRPEEPGYTPSPSFAGIRDAFRPLAVIDRSWRAQYRHGQTVRRTLTVVNDTARDLAGEVTVDLGKTRLFAHELAVGRGRAIEVAAEFSIPAEIPPGRHDYTVAFTAETGERDVWSRSWLVAPPFAQERPLAGVQVCAVGEHAPIAALRELGAEVTAVDSLDAASGHRVIVVGQGVIRGTDEESSQLAALTAEGGRILLLEQTQSAFPALPLRHQMLATAWTRAPGHPLLAGVADADLCFWGEAGYAMLDGDHLVTKAAYRKGDGKHALAVVDAGEGGFGNGDLDAQPLLEVIEGAGLIVASQLLVSGRFADLPVAETLLVNAIRRLDTWTPSEAKGALASEPEAALSAARDGAQVLVDDFSPDDLAEWSRGLGLDLVWIDEPGQHWQAATPEGRAPDALLAGISLEDVCGIESWTYASAKATDHSVADGALAHTAGLEPILVTPTRSALAEFMLLGGKAESLRAHTASRFVYGDERATERVLVGRVRVGAGSVLLSCLRMPADIPRLQRFRHRLLANLGVPDEGSALTGERQLGDANSEGFANVLHRSKHAPDDATWKEVVAATPILTDRVWSQRWLDHCEFDRIEAGSVGVFPGWKPGDSVLVGTSVSSPRARKDLSSDIGVPNPEEQVFCDLLGAGRIEAALNGRSLGEVAFTEGRATLADIELEAGANHLVLRWWPETAYDTLRVEFRDIMRRPEISLSFG